MAMSADANKTFKTKWKVLEQMDHQWTLGYVKEEFMVKDLHFKKACSKSYYRLIF